MIIIIILYSNKLIRGGFTKSHIINYMDELCTVARLFNSQWHNSSTVPGTIIQKSPAPLFNSHWHDCYSYNLRLVPKHVNFW